MTKRELAASLTVAGLCVGIGLLLGRATVPQKVDLGEVGRRLAEHDRRIEKLTASWTGAGLVLAGVANRLDANAAATSARAEAEANPVPAVPSGEKPTSEPPVQDDTLPKEAAVKAHRLIDTAIALGRWTEADYRELHQLNHAMRPEDRDATARKIAVAINQAKLKPDDVRRIF